MAAILASAVVGAIHESVRLARARTEGQLASWTKDKHGNDIPELTLNLSLVAEAFLQLLAAGLGTLALVWATVVLLGGFSTMLVRMDFWFITAIVFIETARVVGYKPAPEARFFVDVPVAFAKRKSLGLGSASDFVRLITLGPALITLAPMFAAPVCMTLSIIRLVDIASHDDYSRSGTDTSKANVKPALILFYALMLAQGLLFLLWFAVAIQRFTLVNQLNKQFEAHSHGKKVMDRYVFCTLDTCIKRGVLSTINRTMVTFAEELVQSENRNDHVSALSVLVTLIRTEERKEQTIDQICSSEKFVGRLLQLLSSKSPLDRPSKAYTTEIIAKLGSNLRLTDIPEAANSISSLLDARFMDIEAELFPSNYLELSKPLFAHGLLILGEFASNPDNCTEIYKAKELLPKMIAPISHGLHKFIGNDRNTTHIVEASLSVVAKLTSNAGETSIEIRADISRNGRIAENLLWIMENSDGEKMKIVALEILSRLSLPQATTGQFIGVLRGLLFNSQDSKLTVPAGRALKALATDHDTCQLIIGEQEGGQYPVIQQLVTIVNNRGNSKKYRTVTAELLAQIFKSSKTEEEINRLRPVSGALSTVLQAIGAETTNFFFERNEIANHTERQTVEFVASLLGLAVQICDRPAITAEALTNAFQGIQMDERAFAQRLMEIVRISTNGTDFVYLVNLKSAIKLATSMMRTRRRYIQYFQQHDVILKLNLAVQAKRDLERYTVLTARADQIEAYESLQSLVKNARDLIWPQQP